ncbi:MAG TPA: RdgB/HAM1 family non-canonical purine NTP pyrophosphatase [Bacteroidetes bacterium]|nr:RdgB/HAM1 family non-canonical purine NTP pyrophosphatase [Bacteroidota bacterium]
MKIIFATHNKHKIEEVRHLVDKRFMLLSLQHVDLAEDIPEDYQTLEENALFKAKFIFQKTGIPTFADDTGLEIAALNNRPGVFSARYAGKNKNDQANMDKVLKELKNADNRLARFRTVIAFVWNDGKEKLFEGIVNGKIGLVKKGKQGFGYDPIFIPDGYNITFAEMPLDVKNSISHRSRAFRKFTSFLNKEFLNDKA